MIRIHPDDTSHGLDLCNIDGYSRCLYYAEDGASGIARAAGLEDSPPRPQPWLRDCVLYSAGVRRRPSRGSGLAVSRAASHDRSRPDHRGLADLGRGSAGPGLRAPREGPPEARGRSETMARRVDGGVENSSRNLTGGASWDCGRGWREPSAAAAMTTTSPRSCGFISRWTSPRGAARVRRGFVSAT